MTIAAPSDDREDYTRHQVRLDNEAAGWREHNFTVHTALKPEIEVLYSPEALITTDVPGPRGYADGVLEGISTEERENDDRAALYTLFGGTSGASAIVAGAVALLQSKKRNEIGVIMDGSEVKNKLNDSGQSQVNWPWLDPLPVPVDTDTPNGEAAGDVTVAHQFGDGVLDLNALLQ